VARRKASPRKLTELQKIRRANYLRWWRMNNSEKARRFMDTHPTYYTERYWRSPEVERERKRREYAQNREVLAERQKNRIGTTDLGAHSSGDEERERTIITTEIRKLRLGRFIQASRGGGISTTWVWEPNCRNCFTRRSMHKGKRLKCPYGRKSYEPSTTAKEHFNGASRRLGET